MRQSSFFIGARTCRFYLPYSGDSIYWTFPHSRRKRGVQAFEGLPRDRHLSPERPHLLRLPGLQVRKVRGPLELASSCIILTKKFFSLRPTIQCRLKSCRDMRSILSYLYVKYFYLGVSFCASKFFWFLFVGLEAPGSGSFLPNFLVLMW